MAGRRLALIVATSEYDDPGLKQLRSPAEDATALGEVLREGALGNFEVDVLEDGTNSIIDERVGRLFGQAGKDDLVLVHFACHGLKSDDGELYLAAKDTKVDGLDWTALASAKVLRYLRRSRAARSILLLDCCFGGAFERGTVVRAGAAVNVADHFGETESSPVDSGQGRAVLTASSSTEFSFDGTRLQDSSRTASSPFTKAIVEGLRTGEADRDQDGAVSITELFDYIRERLKVESPKQTPQRWEYGVTSDLIVAANPNRVIRPGALPDRLLALLQDPDYDVLASAVGWLSRLSGGADLPVAAAARSVLAGLEHHDSKTVSEAATQALSVTAIRLPDRSIDFGTVHVGDPRPIRTVSIEGPPLARDASRVKSSTDSVTVRRDNEMIVVELGTDAPGGIVGTIDLTGPAGSAAIEVRGEVVAAASPKSRTATPSRRKTTSTAKAVPADDREARKVGPSRVPAAGSPLPTMPDWVNAEWVKAPESFAKVTNRAAAASPPSTRRTETPFESHPIARSLIASLLGAGVLMLVGTWQRLPLVTEIPLSAVYFGLIVGVTLRILEYTVPATRLPNGLMYRWTGPNRWTSAFIQGAIVGMIVAVLAAGRFALGESVGLVTIVAISYMVAEWFLMGVEFF